MIEISKSLFYFMLVTSIWGCFKILLNVYQRVRIGEGVDGEA